MTPLTRTARIGSVRSGSDRGFTAIEILLCMVVSVLLAMITVPTYKNVTATFYNKALGYDIGQIQGAAEDAKTLEAIYPASPGDNALPEEIRSRVSLADNDHSVLHYQATADGQAYVLSAWDVRTGTVYCVNTAAGNGFTPTEMPEQAGVGGAQCMASLTAPQHVEQ